MRVILAFGGVVPWVLWAMPYAVNRHDGSFGPMMTALLLWPLGFLLSEALLCAGFALLLIELYRDRGRVWRVIVLTLIGGGPVIYRFLAADYRP